MFTYTDASTALVIVTTSAVAVLILLCPVRTRRLAATWDMGLTVPVVLVGAVVIAAAF